MRIAEGHKISWAAGFLFLLSSFWLDDRVGSFFYSPRGDWANTLMEGASRYGRGWTLALFGVLLLVLGLLIKRKQWSDTGLLALYSMIVSSLSAQILKHLLGRARPRLMEDGLTFLGPSLSAGVRGLDSFPSGHAASTFALAVVLTRAYPRGKVAWYATAGIISLSRLYLGAHFLSDAVGGALLGFWVGHLLTSHAPRILAIGERIEKLNKGLLVTVAIFALSVLLFFHQLKAVPLFDVDEAVFAETTREMMEAGNLITPIYNNLPRYDKPILIYWFMASAFAILGVNELAARFWSALAGCGVVLLTFLFARARINLQAAILSALILATSLETLVLTHLAITDMVLTFFITASLFAFFLAIRRGDSSQQLIGPLAAWAAAAAAVLTKGPIGILLPISVVLVFLWLSGRARQGIRQLKWGWGIALFCSLVVPWYLAVSITTDGDFLRVFFVEHNVMRYLAVNSGHKGPWYYYLLVIAIGFLPWALFLPASLEFVWKSRNEILRDPEKVDLRLFLLLWTLVIFFFFSFARTKLPNYIAPLFPPLSLLVGQWWDRALSGQKSERSVRVSALCGGTIGLILILALVALPFGMSHLQSRFPSIPSIAGLWDLGTVPFLLALTISVSTAGFFVLLRKDRWREGLGLIIAGAVFFSFVSFEALLPKVGNRLQEPLRLLAQSARDRLEPRAPLIVFGLNNPSLLFYAKHPAIIIGAADSQKLREYVRQPQRQLVVTSASLTNKLPNDIPLYPIERRGGYIMLSNSPPEGSR